MTINNKLINIAINYIIAVYKELPYNGFRLHVEDKAPEGTKIAGKLQSNSSSRVISEDELPLFVREAMGLASISDILADITEKPKLMGSCFPSELIDWDGEKWDHIILFYEPIIEKASNVEDLKRLIKECVKHEWRHGCQFNWLRAHDVDVVYAVKKEEETVYGQGPLEDDAYRFQRDEADDLDVAMASFIA